MSFQHLGANERAVLAYLHGEGAGQREIARQLSCSPSTISRELLRGRPTERCGYLAGRAQDLAAVMCGTRGDVVKRLWQAMGAGLDAR